MIDIDDTEPSRIAEFLERGYGDGPLWEDADLAPILEHMLRLPLGAAFAEQTPSPKGPEVEPVLEHVVGDLLTSPEPDLGALCALKRLTKPPREADALPTSVRRVLYFAALAAAEARCGERISSLEISEIHGGFAWCARRGWVPEEIRTTIAAGLEALG